MWRRARRRNESGPTEGIGTPERELVLCALRAVAGTRRSILYDVPTAARPRPLPPGGIFVQGLAPWDRFLAERRRLDDGQLTLLLALRSLDDEERRLVVDSGSTYANSFLLVEPHAVGCDLTSPADPLSRSLVQEASKLLAGGRPAAVEQQDWLRASSVGRLLRQAFGVWSYWSAPVPLGRVEQVRLHLPQPQDTLALKLLAELDRRFPQGSFDEALAYLYYHERELIGGPVPRTRSPFRTRLGMPILRDPRSVDRALRRMVNEGRLTVTDGSRRFRSPFGIGRPVPEAMTEEEFEQLQVL